MRDLKTSFISWCPKTKRCAWGDAQDRDFLFNTGIRGAKTYGADERFEAMTPEELRGYLASVEARMLADKIPASTVREAMAEFGRATS